MLKHIVCVDCGPARFEGAIDGVDDVVAIVGPLAVECVCDECHDLMLVGSRAGCITVCAPGETYVEWEAEYLKIDAPDVAVAKVQHEAGARVLTEYARNARVNVPILER